MTILIVGIIALASTILFDFILFKREQAKEVEASWKALNEKLEREGKQRWDERE